MDNPDDIVDAVEDWGPDPLVRARPPGRAADSGQGRRTPSFDQDVAAWDAAGYYAEHEVDDMCAGDQHADADSDD